MRKASAHPSMRASFGVASLTGTERTPPPAAGSPTGAIGTAGSSKGPGRGLAEYGVPVLQPCADFVPPLGIRREPHFDVAVRSWIRVFCGDSSGGTKLCARPDRRGARGAGPPFYPYGRRPCRLRTGGGDLPARRTRGSTPVHRDLLAASPVRLRRSSRRTARRSMLSEPGFRPATSWWPSSANPAQALSPTCRT